MKKILLSSFLLISLFIQTTKAALVVENLNLVCNASNTIMDVKFANFAIPMFTANYFAVPGSITFSGKITQEYNSAVLVESIGGGNYTPVRLYNNSDFTDMNNYFRIPIFFENKNLTFTNNFKGKGNQYIATRLIFPMSNDTMFVWFLVNLNAAGDELTVLKVGYDDEEFSKRPLTGGDGQNKPTTGVSELNSFNFNLYPQPAKESIQIELNADLKSYSIYALNGQLIEEKLNSNATISTAHLEKGIYIIEVNSSKGILRRKMIIE